MAKMLYVARDRLSRPTRREVRQRTRLLEAHAKELAALRRQNEVLRGALEEILNVARRLTTTMVLPDSEAFANWVLEHVAHVLQ